MNEQIERRLRALEEEYENGRRMLADLEVKQAELRSTLLRISGAIQVLREFLPQDASDAASANASAGSELTDAAAACQR